MIHLHIKDILILNQLHNTLGVGKVRIQGSNSASFVVETIKENIILVDHFVKYPLKTMKASDFLIWKDCLMLLKDKKHLTKEGFVRILELKSVLNLGLSKELKSQFPNVKPAIKPIVTVNKIQEPSWISGFVSGDGSFFVQRRKNNTKFTYSLGFAIHLHVRDAFILSKIRDYFLNFSLKNDKNIMLETNDKDNLENFNVINKKNSSMIYLDKKSVHLQINSLDLIINNLIPFFNMYPVYGTKSLDYKDWVKIAELMSSKKHLTVLGQQEIEIIRVNMNKNRNWKK
jgi:hypothetical protein